MIETLLFIITICVLSYILYKIFESVFKVIAWIVSITIAYIVVKYLFFSGVK